MLKLLKQSGREVEHQKRNPLRKERRSSIPGIKLRNTLYVPVKRGVSEWKAFHISTQIITGLDNFGH